MENKHKMLDAIGISLHHDSITGTSKQVVIYDLVDRIQKVQKENQKLVEIVVGK